ncbi:probable G-protein coupled receptor No18 [Acanthaster planci]|uniref:Probable G-protein coupled receptor No18 n=1 Tax=Acanthaster planci TaxID=133434 RepID=A0A8B7ZBI6_ACAPL|nr:probable G-protein coupled receptor No18 [Acanthaster planci]
MWSVRLGRSLFSSGSGQLRFAGNDSNLTFPATAIEDEDDTTWGFFPEEEVSLQIRWPIGLLLTSLTVFIALGNTLVVLAVLLERQLRTFENFFFVSLAIADLSIALFVLPLTLSVELSDGKWHFGRAACDFFIFVDVSCCTASILHLCTIGLNRFWSISSPLKYTTKQTNRRAFLTIISIWLLSFVVASPPIFGWPQRSKKITNQCTYDEDRLYVVCSALGSFYIPLVVMVIVYFRIYRLSKKGAQFRRSQGRENDVSTRRWRRHVTESNQRSRGFVDGAAMHAVRRPDRANSSELAKSPTAKPQPQNAKKGPKFWSIVYRAASKGTSKESRMRFVEVKTAKTLGLIMSVFVVCWLPFFLLYVIKPFCPSCHIPVTLDRSALWLGYANSLFNPIIYICCKPLFRQTFKKILLLKCCNLMGRYTLHVECCPSTRPRFHHIQRRHHITDKESSFSCRMEYGHLSVNVPPDILHIEERSHSVRSNKRKRSLDQLSWTSSCVGKYYNGSSSSPASVDWTCLGHNVKRVPNSCVSDIPQVVVRNGDDHQPHQTFSGITHSQSTNLRSFSNISLVPDTVESKEDRESRAKHRPKMRTDLILNSDISPRVRVLNRRCTWSEPARWTQQKSSSLYQLKKVTDIFNHL